MISNSGTSTLGLYDLKRQIDAFGGVDYFRPNLAGGYLKNARVMLANGDIVKSTVPNNIIDPNVDMTGWKKTDDNTVESIADLLAIQNPKDGHVVYVKKTDSHFIFKDGEWRPNIIHTINLVDFPRLTSELDDTGRFIRANQAVKMIVATDSPSGVTSVTTTHIYIPFGEYVVSDAIEFNPYVHIISDDMPTIKQTAIGKDIFVFRETYGNCVRGIRFFKGRYPISFSNSNLDETMLKVDNCEFHRSESYAIYTIGLTESQHMSAFIDITNCKFSLCNKIFHNVCDKALLQNSWAYLFLNNFEADSAAIMNKTGQLSIDTLIGVPNLGSPNPFWGTTSRVPNTRWIDNYGVLNCFRCRFGLEADGLTIVHSFGGVNDLQQGMGSSITLRECQISGGDKQWLGDGETGVIRIRAKLPRKIVVDDCNFQYNTPLIVLNQNYDFIGYLDSLLPIQSEIGEYLRKNVSITVKDVESNSTVPIVNIPPVLSQFVNKGLSLTPYSKRVVGGDTYFTYCMPIGANSSQYEIFVSGNINPGGSRFYSHTNRYNLSIGAGYDGSSLVFYISSAKSNSGEVPPVVTISGSSMLVAPFFGVDNTGSVTTANNGANAVRYFTVKVSNVLSVKCDANLVFSS